MTTYVVWHPFRRLPISRIVIAAIVTITGINLFIPRHSNYSLSRFSHLSGASCQNHPGADDVVVVIKTGSTEIEEKLPVHFRTTLTCYPHYLIFSDYEEKYQGHHVYNALEEVSEDIRLGHEDFDLYRKLQSKGRSASKATKPVDTQLSNLGLARSIDSPPSPMDKWMLLPMLNRTLIMYPDKKWYVFLQTDTHIVWANLLHWLGKMDASKPWYIGLKEQTENLIFAYGGSGIIISKPAMYAVVEQYIYRKEELEQYTVGQKSGDAVLGKAMREARIPLLWSWPLMQRDRPSAMEYWRNDYGKRLWCHPAISSSRLSPAQIESMWQFEQAWKRNKSNGLLQYSDMFKSYIMPQFIERHVYDWDNLVGDFDLGSECHSPADCREVCMKDEHCVQWRLSGRKCKTGIHMALGDSMGGRDAPISGWITERVERAVDVIAPCHYDGHWMPTELG